MIPNSIKREKKKYSVSNIISSETNAINNNYHDYNYSNSFKRNISEICLKNSNL